MKEVETVLRILKEAREAIHSENSSKLKTLSGQTIHTATVSQDPDNVVVAVLVYASGKILERRGYKEIEGWDIFHKSLLTNFDKMIKNLEAGNLEGFRKNVGAIRNSVNRIPSRLGDYIRDVFYKAEVNKAFKMYEHGLSSGNTAELLGISLWDLASYIGQSSISESHLNESVPVKKRVKIAEDFFG